MPEWSEVTICIVSISQSAISRFPQAAQVTQFCNSTRYVWDMFSTLGPQTCVYCSHKSFQIRTEGKQISLVIAFCSERAGALLLRYFLSIKSLSSGQMPKRAQDYRPARHKPGQWYCDIPELSSIRDLLLQLQSVLRWQS